MNFVVYIVANAADTLYIGHTNDIARRLNEHNDVTRVSWASRRGPWRIIHTELCTTRSEATKKERTLKSLKSKDKLKEYIAEVGRSIPQGGTHNNIAGWRK